MRTLALLMSAALSVVAPVPNFPLVDQHAKPFQLYDLKGSPLVLTFIYSRCPVSKMCPLTVSQLRETGRLARKNKLGPFRILLATLDPRNDTPLRLRGYAKQQKLEGPLFILATGQERTLSDFAGEFNVASFPSEGTLSHNLKTLLLSSNLETVKQYTDNDWTPKQLVEDLKNLLATQGPHKGTRH